MEKPAQKTVEDLDSRGLLKPEQMKLSKMRDEAGKQEHEMEELVQELADSQVSEPAIHLGVRKNLIKCDVSIGPTQGSHTFCYVCSLRFRTSDVHLS